MFGLLRTIGAFVICFAFAIGCVITFQILTGHLSFTIGNRPVVICGLIALFVAGMEAGQTE